MLQAEEVKRTIEQGLSGVDVYVEGDGQHFQAIVVSDMFIGKSMVQQHQLVYKTLADHIGEDIHALSINTYTQQEWQQKKSSGFH